MVDHRYLNIMYVSWTIFFLKKTLIAVKETCESWEEFGIYFYFNIFCWMFHSFPTYLVVPIFFFLLMNGCVTPDEVLKVGTKRSVFLFILKKIQFSSLNMECYFY